MEKARRELIAAGWIVVLGHDQAALRDPRA
jgi:hypothetical protein